MNDEFVKWIGIIGSLASVFGLPFAIWQIYKTRRAAEAATKAVTRTQKAISRNLLLSEISNCTRNTEEIKSFVRSGKYESALIRANDLISQLIQIQEISKISNQSVQIEFRETISQLSIIRKDFEKKIIKSSAKMDVELINSQLSEISDNLNKFIGETKVVVEKGEGYG